MATYICINTNCKLILISFQIPTKSTWNGLNDTLHIENDWKLNGQTKTTTSLNRLVRQNSSHETLWTKYLPSNVISTKVDSEFGVFCCKNKTMHIIDLENGECTFTNISNSIFRMGFCFRSLDQGQLIIMNREIYIRDFQRLHLNRASSQLLT